MGEERRAVVFDLGGTLMEYRNMPNVWVDFYASAFEHVRCTLLPALSDDDLAAALQKLRSYNPSVNYREVDYTPEKIFTDVTAGWPGDFQVQDVIRVFFSSMQLEPYIYPETLAVLQKLKADGYVLAALTDVATGMPDELHRSYCKELLPYFDLYISSVSCGWRKPNPKGLEMIAERFSLSPQAMLYVGDEKKDILCAKRFGCRSVLVDRKGSGADFGQDFTVKDLNGLYVDLGHAFAGVLPL